MGFLDKLFGRKRSHGAGRTENLPPGWDEQTFAQFRAFAKTQGIPDEMVYTVASTFKFCTKHNKVYPPEVGFCPDGGPGQCT
ncbi:MAG TPA: hypothetical protein DCP08_02770 [Chloroflexi bacterium]|nr:hypothetical protein [Chloroflexota bacterium]